MNEAKGFPAFPPQRRARRFARSWWGNAWLTALEQDALDAEQLRKGRRYAYAGHVGTTTVSPGRIAAAVHDGDADTPYRTVVHVERLGDAEWARFLDRVAARAGYVAALLDRDMPHELVEAAADAGVPLLPGMGDLNPECECPGWEHPCKHAAALCHQVSWLLDADPFVLLLMRGRGERELLAELGMGGAPAADEPPPGIDPEALELLVADAAARARELLAPPGPAEDQDREPDREPYGPPDEERDAARLLRAHAALFPWLPGRLTGRSG
jgi:uncharacterized Zn finger protein